LSLYQYLNAKLKCFLEGNTHPPGVRSYQKRSG
jgi:hypothetical protein